MYMMSSRLVGRGLRLQIPDVSPATVAAIFNLNPETTPTSPADTIYNPFKITAGRILSFVNGAKKILNVYFIGLGITS